MSESPNAPESSPHRVTQKVIAQAAGVSRVAVSYALRNDPNVSLSTRRRIQKLAREMGYTPDPMLVSLASYRNRQRPAAFHGNLVWIEHFVRSGYQKSGLYQAYYESARERALWHGYKLERFPYDPSVGEARILSILRARSISGILLNPFGPDEKIVPVWKYFPTILFGYHHKSPQTNSVASALHINTRTVLSELRRRGYRRIGAVLDALKDSRSENAFSSAFLGEQYASTSDCAIPMCAETHPLPANPDASPDISRMG